MKLKNRFLTLTVFVFFSFGICFAQTTEDKKVIDEINFARTKPQEYVKKVLEPLVDGRLGTYQSAVVECISLMRTMNPLSELAWSKGLYETARDKSGSDYSARLSKHVSWTFSGEMTVYGYSEARDIVLSLLLDIETPDRTHRRAVLSDRFSHAASSIITDAEYGHACVLDFASDCISYSDLPGILYHEDSARQIVSEINLVRTKPLEYISTRLQPISKGNGKFQKEVSELISYLKNFTPVTELSYNDDLCDSSKKSMDYLEKSSPMAQNPKWEKNIRSVRDWGTVAEAFIAGETDPRAAVIKMLLDSSSKNRSNILAPGLNYAGAYVGKSAVVCVNLASWHDETNTPLEGLLAGDGAEHIIAEINWARSNPKEYSKVRLEPLVKKEKNPFQTALSELIREMERMKPVPQLKTAEGLCNAAAEQVSAQGKTSSTAYDSAWLSRIARYGTLNGGSEILYFGQETPETAVACLLIDAGSSLRNRRKALLSQAYEYAGAATGIHGIYGGMALIELARGFTPASESVFLSGNSDYGNDITNAEVEVLKEINFARVSPASYVRTRLLDLVTSEKNSWQEALSELISDLNGLGAVSKIDFSTDLHECAADFASSAKKSGKSASDASWIDRVSGSVSWSKAAELVSLGCYTAKDIVIQLLVDDGVSDRGHRRILLNKDMTHAGVAIDVHPKYGTICVIDLIRAD
ncbi:MAG: hypothetical protein II716_07770 [Treponema sp.]|nr:hypothetical protein [Treponema sp.]